MPFDLDRDDQTGIWTEYPPSPDERYQIRPLTPALVQHFIDITTRKVRDRTGQWEEHRDDKRYQELLWDHVLSGWEGITTGGKPNECNLENKLKLAGMSGERARWIVDTALLYANDDHARHEAEQRAFRGLDAAAPRHAMVDVSGVSGPRGAES
jgi:hypothetical protein